jgi:hypothetical protein
MATKTEERMKIMLEEYLEIKHQKQTREIMDHIYSIFVWGVIFGTLISYMSMMPIIFGTVLGYVLSKKQWLFIEKWMESWYKWILLGEKYWKNLTLKINQEEKEKEK